MEQIAIGEHILLTIIPWLAGIGVGGLLGAITATAAYYLFKSVRVLRKVAILLPWRGIVATLAVIILMPFIVREIGLGPTAGGLMVGLVLTLLTWGFSVVVLVDNWHPISPVVQMIGLARTLLMAGEVLAVLVGFVGGGGVGFIAMRGFNLFRMEMVWQNIAVVAVTALVLDIVLGAIHMGVAFIGDRKPVEDALP